ncbi:NUDIX hydrolase [Hyperthermus butylicus]|uniref:Universally conserved protein n=1 Tax=Hyperthermus butylicus (strain DSM 5456 / JCM 9403 / PLM1-5) TaxID=415426 RepID=A2BL65_HYPBU|nr:NUDIX domain-containing protein [Hyperthermus butylicus]ABM80726.1 universally conserved protein [Hyperthermus butylicus DSM 5456]
MLFRVAARCIILRDGKILVQLSKKGDFYRLPGGRIRPDETIVQGLQREVHEELGIEKIENMRLIFIVDSFYKRRSGLVHEVGFYFLCDVGDAEIKPREEHLRIEWIEPEQLDSKNFRPSALAPHLRRIREVLENGLPAQYIINVDVGGQD